MKEQRKGEEANAPKGLKKTNLRGLEAEILLSILEWLSELKANIYCFVQAFTEVT